MVLQFGGVDVILAIGTYEWDGGESVEYQVACLRARKTLKQLLKDETGRQDELAVTERANQGDNLRRAFRSVSTECE